MGIRSNLGKIARVALAPLDLSISRIRPVEPDFQPINIFELCALDLMRRVQSPFVLQIGANDGIRFDPVRPFMREWSGLMIEPHPVVYKDLVKNYRDFDRVRTLNVAIAEIDGSLELYAPDDEIIERFPDLSGLCSINKDVLIRTMEFQKINNPSGHIRKFEVKAKTVSSLLAEGGIGSIDVLQIDTEGYDWKILSQFDLDGLGVNLINMEFAHLKHDERCACISHLNALGFHLSRYHLDIVAYRPR